MASTKSKVYRGVPPAVPAQQRRQNALEGCRRVCRELGFAPEEAPERSLQGTAEAACELVDAVAQLGALQLAAALRQDRELYGGLLSPAELQAKADQLSEAVEALAFITQNKDRLVGFLQQPHNGPCLPVEHGCQQPLLHLLRLALADAGLLRRGLADVDWVLQFREPSTVWTQLLQPTPQVAAIVTECHESLTSVHQAIDSLGLATAEAA